MLPGGKMMGCCVCGAVACGVGGAGGCGGDEDGVDCVVVDVPRGVLRTVGMDTSCGVC